MAYAKVKLVHQDNNTTYAPLGFSWVVLFFGFLVPIFRKDYVSAIVMLLLSIVTFSVSNIICACIYNGINLRFLLKSGCKITEVTDVDENSLDLKEINPISFSVAYDKHYIWVDFFLVKYMKYFETKVSAVQFVKDHPNRCLKIKHLTLSLRNYKSVMDDVNEKYTFPYDYWELNVPTK